MLDLNELAEGRFPAITEAIGATFAEAAGVCLESQGHSPGVQLIIRGDKSGDYTLEWTPVTLQAQTRAWNDTEEATEFGAAGIAILLAEKELGYVATYRSRKGTGFDYWLGDASDGPFSEHKARLEVSGIRQGNEGIIRARVRQKIDQIEQTDASPLPAYVIVVEFSHPIAEVRMT